MASAASLDILLRAMGVSRTKQDLESTGTSADKMAGRLDRAGASGDSMGARIASGAKIAALAATAAAAGLAVFSVKAASDMAEAQNKVNVVFGESAEAINAFARGAAQNLGLSRSEALSAAGTFGNLFVAMKIGKPEAAAMSQGILTLASDLASFNNISTTDALEKLRAGLVGETEPLRALGVNLTAAQVETQALAMGFKKVGGELTASSKAQAAYALIMQQTTTAQGDFKNTSTGMANSLRIIEASVKDAATEIGGKLLPLVEPLISGLAQALPGALAAAMPVLEGFGNAIGLIANTVKAFVTGEGFDVLYEQINTTFGEATGARIASILDPLARVRDEGLAPLGEVAANVGRLVVEQAGMIAENLLAWGRAFIEWVGPMVPPLLAELGAMVGRLWAWIRAEGPGMLQRFVSEWVPAAIGWVAEAAVAILPELAKFIAGIGVWLVTVAVPELLGLAADLGVAIIRGIWEGLSKLGGWLMDRMRELALGALNAVKGVLGISSPSRLFAEVGEEIGAGLVEGIEASTPAVLGAVSALTGAVIASASQMLDEFRALTTAENAQQAQRQQALAAAQRADQVAAFASAVGLGPGATLGGAMQQATALEQAQRAQLESRIAALQREQQMEQFKSFMLQRYGAETEVGALSNLGLPVERDSEGGLISSRDFWGEFLRSLPSFAGGGVVPGALGSPQLAMVHGGETVSPRGSGATVNVDMRGAIISSAADAEQWVAQAFTRVFRRGGFPYLAGT